MTDDSQAAEAAPPPGFYDDGSGRQRWWDGVAWTEHRQGAPAPAPPDVAKDGLSGTAIAGYILSLLLPFVGFFVGLALIARGDRHGIWVTLLAVGVFLAYIAMVAS